MALAAPVRRAGVDGLLRDKTRARQGHRCRRQVAQVVALTCAEPPGEATHWTGRAMAKGAGISLARCSGSGPRTACSRTASAPSSSRTTRLRRQARDIVGLYLDPPAHAVVLSVDEKSQIQALDRTQPGLPMKGARPAR